MTLDTLRSDLTRNVAVVKLMARTEGLTPDVLASHLRDALWPFLESLVDEMSEQADALDEITRGEADILTEETGQSIAATVTMAVALVAELQKRLADTPNDKLLLQQINTFYVSAKQTEQVLRDITIPDDEDEEDDEEEGDGDGEPGDDDGGDDDEGGSP